MIFVTGGTGLLGSHFLLQLTSKGEKVRAIYRDRTKIKQVEQLFEFYKSSKDQFDLIEWVECDVLDVVTLDELMQGIDEVYHCAAMVSFRKKDYNLMLKTNRQGTANVVNCALSNGVKRFLHVSSTAAVGKVYDQEGAGYVVETNKWDPEDNHSGYAVTKYLSENEVWRGIEEGLHAVIINPSVIIGPGNWNESSLSIFKTLANGLQFYTAGANAFVDVRDVVRAAQMLIKEESVFGQRYLCTGTNISFKELFDIACVHMNRKSPRFLAGAFLSGFAWRLSAVLYLITGKQTVTKDSARSAQAIVRYDSKKLISKLNFQFISIQETIKHCIDGRV